MIDDCPNCCAKHIAQGCVCYLETLKGHPEKRFLVIGHLAEAEDAIIQIDESMAMLIRDQRLLYEQERKINFNYLFEQMEAYYANNSEGKEV